MNAMIVFFGIWIINIINVVLFGFNEVICWNILLLLPCLMIIVYYLKNIYKLLERINDDNNQKEFQENRDKLKKRLGKIKFK